MNEEIQNEFKRRYEPLLGSVFERMQSCLPRDWGLATLERDVGKLTSEKTRKISFQLRNPSNRQAVVPVPVALAEATGRLHALCCDYGHSWSHAIITLVFDNAGRVMRSQAHYDYDQPAASATLS